VVIERILLASDGPGAWTTAAAVADLVAASPTPVEVEVLHVDEAGYRTPPEAAEPSGLVLARRNLVDQLVDGLRRHGIRASGRVRPGRFTDVADDIVDEAEVCGAGLIAMSCRPRSPIHVFTGSVSQTVIMRAGCPVMVVREPGFRL
jgi:nucleotide-binding universal stress UspA family protein